MTATVTRDALALSESATGQGLDVPTTTVAGAQTGPCVLVTGAIHGDEVLGVAVVRRLLAGLPATLVRGTVVAVPVCNRFGFERGERYLPDRRDLNRAFPGKAQGTMAQRVAHSLFRLVRQADVVVDLHTAAEGNTNLCHVRGDAKRADVKRIMKAFGCPILMDGAGPKGSLRRAATEAGIPSIVFEAGEPRRFQPHAVDVGHLGLVRLLGHLGMMQHTFPRPEFQVLVRETDWLRADRGGILELDVEPGDLVQRGDALGRIVDPLGDHVDTVTAPRSGVVLGATTTPHVYPGTALVHLGRLDKTFAKAKAFVAAGGDLGHLGWSGLGEAVPSRVPAIQA